MEAAKITIKTRRGHVIVQAMGRTGRGQSYIKAFKVLDAPSISDPKFKDQMASAVDELLGRTA